MTDVEAKPRAETRLDIAQPHRSMAETLDTLRHPAKRLGAAALAGALLGAPLALQQALEHTSVQDNIAGFPATLEFTHQGGSQLDIGLLGRAYIPKDGPLGIGVSVEAKDLPFNSVPNTSSLLSARYVAKLAGFYNHPTEAVKGPQSALVHEYSRQLQRYELLDTALFGSLIYTGSLAFTRERRQALRSRSKSVQAVAVAGLAAAALTPSVYGAYQFSQWQGNNPPVSTQRYTLNRLQDTPLEGLTVSNRELKFAVDTGIDKVKMLLARQSRRQKRFIEKASAGLQAQADAIRHPAEDEEIFMVGSDMHDSEAMTQLARQTVDTINQKFGDHTLDVLFLAGDLGYGESLEKPFIDAQATIADHVVVSPGNHETAIAEEEIDDAGMHRIKDKPVSVNDIVFGGGEDPVVTPFGGSSTIRHPSSATEDVEAEFGARLYEQASQKAIDVIGPHEGYAAGSFLGLEQVTQTALDQWFSERGSNTIPWDDGVRDLPTSLLVYGHWHRMVEPRTVWNSDGSWTLVMELNTMGGAIADPTINRFSTPNDAPGQTASFPVMYMNKNTKLITGYQMYTFESDGTMTISDFVPIGLAGGQPPAGSAAAVELRQTKEEAAKQPTSDHAAHIPQ